MKENSMASDNFDPNIFITHTPTDSVITELSRALSIDEVAAQIIAGANQEDDAVLQNARRAAELKRRILAGEAGRDVKWMEWMMKRIHMSKSHLYALVEIGSASDPREAMEQWRRRARQRSKLRVISSDLSANHRNMIKLVRKLTDQEATTEYLALWKRYQLRL